MSLHLLPFEVRRKDAVPNGCATKDQLSLRQLVDRQGPEFIQDRDFRRDGHVRSDDTLWRSIPINEAGIERCKARLTSLFDPRGLMWVGELLGDLGQQSGKGVS